MYKNDFVYVLYACFNLVCRVGNSASLVIFWDIMYYSFLCKKKKCLHVDIYLYLQEVNQVKLQDLCSQEIHLNLNLNL